MALAALAGLGEHPVGDQRRVGGRSVGALRAHAGQRVRFALVAAHAGVFGLARPHASVHTDRAQIGAEHAQAPEQRGADEAGHNREAWGQHPPTLCRPPRDKLTRRQKVAGTQAEIALVVSIMVSQRPSLAFLLTIGLVLGGVFGTIGCNDDDEIGTPCETDDDCSSELTCDVHEGEGTCQDEHGHTS